MLRPGGTVVEGTSGSTGISLAGICNAKGYKCVIFMPDDQAIEKRELLRSLGAEVQTVKPCAISNPGHYVKQAQKYAETHENAVFIDQFENAANADIHYASTGICCGMHRCVCCGNILKFAIRCCGWCQAQRSGSKWTATLMRS